MYWWNSEDCISSVIIVIMKSLFLCLELQILLTNEKKKLLLKSQELDYSRKQIADLKRKLELTSTLSSGSDFIALYSKETLTCYIP